MKYDHALLSVKQMAEADRLAIKAGIPGIMLMENAGRVVSEAITKRWSPRPTLVLCGPGNNGGDGFVVARLLAQKGWKVTVALSTTREKLKGDAKHHANLWKEDVYSLSPRLLDNAELVVDALFGAGLTRKVSGKESQMLIAAAEKSIPVIAVDIPSGVMGDTGESLGAIKADLTVTFFRKKPGHLLLPGRDLCGEIIVSDIGIPESVLSAIAPDTYENTPELWLKYLPKPEAASNKYTRGHALIYGGYPMTGAARLSAKAAMRSGAGLTTLVCNEKAFPIYAGALESTIVKSFHSAKDFKSMLSDKRLTAFLIGPGAGKAKVIRPLIAAMLGSKRPVVLDADAISAYKGNASLLRKTIKYPCVLTPHEGEFARLLSYKEEKLSRACKAAKYLGAVILLKGSDTVIAAPDGRAIINSNAPATLATAGSGDVLAGIILGLLAQGMDTFFATAAAAWLHAEAAKAFGNGLIAEDIYETLPHVLDKIQQYLPLRGVKRGSNPGQI